MADQIRILDRLIQTKPFDLRALLRLATWGCVAATALMLAVLSSSIGTKHQAFAPSTAAPQIPAATVQLTTRQSEPDKVTRQLSEAVSGLAADRDRLVTRIASLERSLEDVTGSIKQQAASSPAPAQTSVHAPTTAPATAAAQASGTAPASGLTSAPKPLPTAAPAPTAGAPPPTSASPIPASSTPLAPRSQTQPEKATPAAAAPPAAAPPPTAPPHGAIATSPPASPICPKLRIPRANRASSISASMSAAQPPSTGCVHSGIRCGTILPICSTTFIRWLRHARTRLAALICGWSWVRSAARRRPPRCAPHCWRRAASAR
jgi:hypothetical protein